MPFVIFRGDHLRSTSGIICGSGSFAVQFGDHFRSGDHLRSGIICGAVHIAFVSNSLEEQMLEENVSLFFFYLKCITAKEQDDETTTQSPSDEHLFPTNELGLALG